MRGRTGQKLSPGRWSHFNTLWAAIIQAGGKVMEIEKKIAWKLKRNCMENEKNLHRRVMEMGGGGGGNVRFPHSLEKVFIASL